MSKISLKDLLMLFGERKVKIYERVESGEKLDYPNVFVGNVVDVPEELMGRTVRTIGILPAGDMDICIGVCLEEVGK